MSIKKLLPFIVILALLGGLAYMKREKQNVPVDLGERANLKALVDGELVVSVSDHQGNIVQVVRKFSVAAP